MIRLSGLYGSRVGLRLEAIFPALTSPHTLKHILKQLLYLASRSQNFAVQTPSTLTSPGNRRSGYPATGSSLTTPPQLLLRLTKHTNAAQKSVSLFVEGMENLSCNLSHLNSQVLWSEWEPKQLCDSRGQIQSVRGKGGLPYDWIRGDSY